MAQTRPNAKSSHARSSHAKSSNDALHQLHKLRVELEAKLLQNSDYRALIAIDRVVNELGSGIKGRQHAAAGPAKKLSQTEATAQVLQEKGKPLSLEELVGLLKAKGVTFRGKRPELSLSANLSSQKQFRSVKYNGARCWWFSNRSIPLNAGAESASDSGLSNQI